MNGWIYLDPPDGLMAWALKRATEMDGEADLTRPGRVHSHATRSERASGIAAEKVLAGWLEHKGARYVHHGGNDALPDFEVSGRGVAVRCCGAKVPYKPTHIVYVFDAHLLRFEQWFFIGYERTVDRFVLLGGAGSIYFREHSRFAEAGETILPGFTCSAPLWYTQTTTLTPPADWLRAL